MRNLAIPKPEYDFTNAERLPHLLSVRLENVKRNKIGMGRLSLYGAYKYLRLMPRYATLGDFLVLSESIFFLRKAGYPPTKKEIRRCMMYFEPKLSQWERKQLAETFFKEVN